jgi:hypothetical protein
MDRSLRGGTSSVTGLEHTPCHVVTEKINSVRVSLSQNVSILLRTHLDKHHLGRFNKMWDRYARKHLLVYSLDGVFDWDLAPVELIMYFVRD